MMVKGSIIGIISGLILGLFLKWVEIVTSIKVYTLLLNVDFIPIIGDYIWPEWIEFGFHLIISIIIGILFVFIVERMKYGTIKQFFVSFILTFPTFFLFFPLSLLAIKEVPAATDWLAFAWWIMGHLFYFISIPLIYWLLQKNTKNRAR